MSRVEGALSAGFLWSMDYLQDAPPVRLYILSNEQGRLT